ncbi:hypothetical protein F0P96_13080 [Hymenobacter busanensis]|uniref:Uncharacterized protein n=1 Tax=Hymenobacter busanensis TaxID=2607656 RepID=A0A7L4ZYF4_9BACT|nr:hypothetical protein [Hymenobacter busanensis]KAA9332401.1 hypothetical protein F0P96_13080 [Hymenobacter busanensis]QHJ07262.1 hypothetical protein GUY19_08195 [Hymenobacter busanensis]
MTRYFCTALLLTLVACQQKDPQTVGATATAAEPAAPAAPADSTAAYLANPKIGDVLVVRFQPQGTSQEQFFFYQVFKLSGDTVLTHPAFKPVASADADTRTPGVFSPDAERAYTRAELASFQREDPLDPQHSRLVRIRR